MNKANPPQDLIENVKLAHFDTFMGGVASIGKKASIPSAFKNEALQFAKKNQSSRNILGFSRCIGSYDLVPTEKSVLTNVAASSDFYSSPCLNGIDLSFLTIYLNACQEQNQFNGYSCIKAMILHLYLISFLKGKFSQIFSNISISTIAGCMTYGAILSTNSEHIENAVNLYLSKNYQSLQNNLSKSYDSLSSGLNAEAAIMSVKRSINGLECSKSVFNTILISESRLNEKDKYLNENFSVETELPLEENEFGKMNIIYRFGSFHINFYPFLLLILNGAMNGDFSNISSHEKIVSITLSTPDQSLILNNEVTNRYYAFNSITFQTAISLIKAIGFQQNNRTKIEEAINLLTPTWYDYSSQQLFSSNVRNLFSKINIKSGPQHELTILLTDNSEITLVNSLPTNKKYNLQQILTNKWTKMIDANLNEKDLNNLYTKHMNLEHLLPNDLAKLYAAQIKYSDHSFQLEV